MTILSGASQFVLLIWFTITIIFSYKMLARLFKTDASKKYRYKAKDAAKHYFIASAFLLAVAGAFQLLYMLISWI